MCREKLLSVRKRANEMSALQRTASLSEFKRSLKPSRHIYGRRLHPTAKSTVNAAKFYFFHPRFSLKKFWFVIQWLQMVKRGLIGLQSLKVTAEKIGAVSVYPSVGRLFHVFCKLK